MNTSKSFYFFQVNKPHKKSTEKKNGSRFFFGPFMGDPFPRGIRPAKKTTVKTELCGGPGGGFDHLNSLPV